MQPKFVNVSDFPPPGMPYWEPLVVKRAQIEREIARLADEPRPSTGIRAARIVHPQAIAPGLGLSPGIDVTINVLKPGEETTPIRHNSSQISICLRGEGQARIGQSRLALEWHDVWNTPGMHPYTYRNDGNDLFVRLTYSNGALLERLLVHYVEHIPAEGFSLANDFEIRQEKAKKAKALADPILVGTDGAQLLTYEHLISPEPVDNRALRWPWKLIAKERDRVFPEDRTEKRGRSGLFVLYNPATGRTVGTTHNFFASTGFMPAGTKLIDFPHRHSSNAINYALDGQMVSEVNGERLIWEEGDIAYTAPGWSSHANGTDGVGGSALTIQDHPFQIATDCLIWQEKEDQPVRLLGSQQGFELEDVLRELT